VFPFFLFIVGVAVTFSFGDIAGGRPGRYTVLRILRRTALLLRLGLALDALMISGGLSSLRIPGVPQRIAVCYLAAALLFLWTEPRSQAMLLVCCTLLWLGATTLLYRRRIFIKI
jgi:predicted acyltransferase